ncbi:hypothetical protein OROGR_032752 [Orobanche gracilis]
MGDSESCSSRQSEWSPVWNRKSRQKVEVCNELLYRLRELDVEEANEPGFEEELSAHFSMLPPRYALEVNTERAEDVLMHKKLLTLARDPLTRPAVDVRLVQICPTYDENHSNSVYWSFTEEGDALQQDSFHLPTAFGLAFEGNSSVPQDGNGSLSRNSHFLRPLHEITISTMDKPKLLSKLTYLIWGKGIGHLRNILMKEIPNIESTSKQELLFPAGGQGHSGFMLPPNHVELPYDESDVWESDASLLRFEYKIASGSSGDLYKGLFHSQDVAIKILRNECLGVDMQREFAQEVYILRKVRHKNVVQFIGACTRPPLLCINLYPAEACMISSISKGVFKLPAILKVAIDVSKGMSYLHSNNIIHRDLKAANILMDENEVVKIADFGVSRVQLQSGVMTAETGTYRWMAPDVIEHKPYNHKADVFSFGVVLWELLAGKQVPYAHLTPLQAAVGVVQKGLRPTIPGHTHPLVVELLERCWQQEPSLRPEFSEIIEILQYMAKEILEEEYQKEKSGRTVSAHRRMADKEARK